MMIKTDVVLRARESGPICYGRCGKHGSWLGYSARSGLRLGLEEQAACVWSQSFSDVQCGGRAS